VITKPGFHLMMVLILILVVTGLPILVAPDRAHSPTPPRPHRSAFLSPRTSADLCPPLSPPSGTVVTVSTEAELRDQAYNAAAGPTIVLSKGGDARESETQDVKRIRTSCQSMLWR
jgi:hypothetical protein